MNNFFRLASQSSWIYSKVSNSYSNQVIVIKIVIKWLQLKVVLDENNRRYEATIKVLQVYSKVIFSNFSCKISDCLSAGMSADLTMI